MTYRRTAMSLVALVLALPVAAQAKKTTSVVYDDPSAPGYSITDYNAHWAQTFGPLELASGGTQTFGPAGETVNAAPFSVWADFSVFDHLKYFGGSTASFPVPSK